MKKRLILLSISIILILNINLILAEQTPTQKIQRDYSGYIIEFEDESIIERKIKTDKKAIENEEYINDSFILNPIAIYKRLFSIKPNEVNKIINDYSKDLENKNNKIKKKFLTKPLDPNKEFKNIFNGISLNITDKEAEEIRKIKGIKRVYKNMKVNPLLDSSVPYTEADYFWNKNIYGENCNGENCLDGSGVTVAIVDTGISYEHPDFGGCSDAEFLAGNCEKVVGGYDFVDNDNLPEDKYDGHGTHVAGIVGANGIKKGVAPGVTIYAYKVLRMAGGDTEHLIAGINRAMDPNMDGDFSDRIDIISMSAGTNCQGVYNIDCGPEDAISSAVLEAINAGSIVVVSAGNDGPDANTITSPGVLDEVISVGAHYNNDNSGVNSNVNLVGIPRNIPSFPLTITTPSEGIEGQLIDMGIGNPGDYISKNVQDKIVLASINKGEPFFSKIYHAEKNGAKGIIIRYNSINEIQRYFVTGLNIPAVFIGKEDGIFLVNNANNRVEINIENNPQTVGRFSSRGPVEYNGVTHNKPDILAPGVSINSSNALWLLGGSYPNWEYHTSYSGTSMAAPHISGIIALIKQANPDITHQEVKELLIENANPLPGIDINSQGAGIVDVKKLIEFQGTSRIINSGETLSGELNIRLEKFENPNWITKKTFTQLVLIEEDFDLKSYWNSNHITTSKPGLYRANIILTTNGETTSSHYKFIVE
jgi:subtilisin family serine protease